MKIKPPLSGEKILLNLKIKTQAGGKMVLNLASSVYKISLTNPTYFSRFIRSVSIYIYSCALNVNKIV